MATNSAPACAGSEFPSRRGDVTTGLAAASDWEREGSKGETFVSLNGKLMDMYLAKYPHVKREDFGAFSINAHT